MSIASLCLTTKTSKSTLRQTEHRLSPRSICLHSHQVAAVVRRKSHFIDTHIVTSIDYSRAIIVDNIPSVDPEKVDRLKTVLLQIYNQFGETLKEEDIEMPMDNSTRKSFGYSNACRLIEFVLIEIFFPFSDIVSSSLNRRIRPRTPQRLPRIYS